MKTMEFYPKISGYGYGFKVGELVGFFATGLPTLVPALATITAIDVSVAKVFVALHFYTPGRHSMSEFLSKKTTAVYGDVVRKYSIPLPFGGEYVFETSSYEIVPNSYEDMSLSNAEIIQYDTNNQGNRLIEELKNQTAPTVFFQFPFEKSPTHPGDYQVCVYAGKRGTPTLRNKITGESLNVSNYLREGKQLRTCPGFWLAEVTPYGRYMLTCSTDYVSE